MTAWRLLTMSRSFMWHVHCSGIYIRDVPFNKVNLLPVKISCRWCSSTCKRLGNVPHYKYKEKSHQRVSAHQAAAHQGPSDSQRAASHGAHQAINYQDILESQGVAADTRLLPLKQQLQLTRPHWRDINQFQPLLRQWLRLLLLWLPGRYFSFCGQIEIKYFYLAR